MSSLPWSLKLKWLLEQTTSSRSMLATMSSCTCGCSEAFLMRISRWVSTVTRVARLSMMNWLISSKLILCVLLRFLVCVFYRLQNTDSCANKGEKKASSFFNLMLEKKSMSFMPLPSCATSKFESHSSPFTSTNANPSGSLTGILWLSPICGLPWSGNWKGSDTSTRVFAARSKTKAWTFSVLFCNCEYICRFRLYYIFYWEWPEERLKLKQFWKQEEECIFCNKHSLGNHVYLLAAVEYNVQ